ncbi:MAG: transglycosylase SLT domain-containing protein [Bacteroidota bacterium]
MILRLGQRLIWIVGIWLVIFLPIQLLTSERKNTTKQIDTKQLDELLAEAAISITVFNNDSLAELSSYLPKGIKLDHIPKSAFTRTSQRVFSPGVCYTLLEDPSLYQQRWDTMNQVRFWRTIMRLPNDTALITATPSRRVLGGINWKQWNELSEEGQISFKDSLERVHVLDSTEQLMITFGKSHYYHFDRVIPTLARGIQAFEKAGVDPWYAQAILLIESPGQLALSPVGAYGSFQLMESVAREHGLIVNDTLDERADFFKAAWAAASLLRTRCIPQARNIVQRWELPPNEKDLWFRLLVLHIYHAGAGNVGGAINQMQPDMYGPPLLERLWRTEYGGFKNASQNYSQIALASLLELDQIVKQNADTVCFDRKAYPTINL